MAETRRVYIFGAFLSSILSILFIIIAVSSENWVVSTATAQSQFADSEINYGLFAGEFILNDLSTPNYNTLHMTCVPEANACALSCKTERSARLDEVRALADGLSPNPACVSTTTVTNTPLKAPAVISFVFYIFVIVLLFVQLLGAVAAALLAIINAIKNPTEPVFGLPGCLWINIITAVTGFTVLLMFGIYYGTSGLNDHLAFSYIAIGLFEAGPGLGYSYWVLLISVLCSLTNVGLILLRQYLLERDPQPPVIKVDAHSDGTVFLY